MSDIKLKKSQTDSVGTNTDIDHEDKPFNKFTINLNHPVTKDGLYMEFSKTDSSLILQEKEDGVYVKEEDVEYLKKHWEADEYSYFLQSSTLVPASEGDLGEDVNENFPVPKTTGTYDEVYVNKQLVRTDYNIGLHQAKPLIEEVEKVFGKDQDWKGNRFNIIGTYTAYEDAPLRPPYTHEKTYSWYNVYSYPAQELLDEFKVPDVGYKYHVWHSIKYNTVTAKKQLKLVIEDNEYTSNYQKHPDTFIARPEVPIYAPTTFFFAKIFDENGKEADQYDVFFVTTKEIMKEFCEKKGLDFPIPESREDDFVWIYGFVYDKKTLEITQVKGYLRYPTDQNDWL